jgi:hypothetical protein
MPQQDLMHSTAGSWVSTLGYSLLPALMLPLPLLPLLQLLLLLLLLLVLLLLLSRSVMRLKPRLTAAAIAVSKGF